MKALKALNIIRDHLRIDLAAPVTSKARKAISFAARLAERDPAVALMTLMQAGIITETDIPGRIIFTSRELGKSEENKWKS
jgi:hypothetical protein